MRFNSKATTIFLDTKNENYEITTKKVNIVLSPSLYWVKKLSLPVKYIRDVLKLLPSVFEEMLPAGNYSYSAYKHGDDYIVFAYEDKKILDLLSSYGIQSSNVLGVYFAQKELQNIEGAIKVNEKQSVYVKDDIVVLVPCCWIEEKGELNLAHLTLSNYTIRLKQYAHIVDNSSLYKVGVVLFLLSIIMGGEYFITSQKVAQVQKQKDELMVKYKLKPTMFQNKALLKKYNKIHTKQTNLRTHISYILSSKLKNDEKLSLLSMKGSTLKVHYINSSNKTLNRLQKVMQRKKVKFESNINNTTIDMELSI